jgi:hypothetical protein
LSFATADGFLGGYITEADSFARALTRATIAGHNPGGEVAGVGFRAVSVPATYLDRLLSKVEVLAMPMPDGAELL